MKEELKNYSLLELNKDINELVKDKKVNNFNMFVAAEKNEKLSVTIKPDRTKKEIYHGLRPDFDEDFLRLFLYNLKINEAQEFWNCIKKIQKRNKMMNLIIPDFEKDEEIYEEYLSKLINNQKLKGNLEVNLFGKAVLQMASHFGYEIVTSDEQIYYSFEKKLKDLQNESNVFYQCDEKSKTVKLLGVWPEKNIKNLCREFDIDIEGNALKLKKNNQNENNNCLYGMLNFKEDLHLKYFKLLTSDIYYSGVMPCVKEIEVEKNLSLSKKIKFIVFNVVRTTYTTVDAMDNSQILEHPFFDEKTRKELIEFDNYEDILQNKYLHSKDVDESADKFKQIEYEQRMIRNLNIYLKYSFNTHTIAVSINLITEDGYLIAGKRGNLNIDAGEYRCLST